MRNRDRHGEAQAVKAAATVGLGASLNPALAGRTAYGIARGLGLRAPVSTRPVERVYPKLARRLPPGTMAQFPGWHYPLIVPVFVGAFYVFLVITYPFAAVSDPIWQILLPLIAICLFNALCAVWLIWAWRSLFFIDAADQLIFRWPTGKVIECPHADIVSFRPDFRRGRLVIFLHMSSGKTRAVSLAAFRAPHLLCHLILMSARIWPPHETLNFIDAMCQDGQIPPPTMPLDQLVMYLRDYGAWPPDFAARR